MKITDNKKAYHDYFILEKIEAGIVLTGTEIKSIRKRRLNLKDSYGAVVKNEIFLEGVHISHFKEGNRFNHEHLRARKLLLHKRQISSLIGKIKKKGFTLIPLSFYFNGRGKVKVSLGLAKGKKLYDKRHILAKKESDRQIERVLKKKTINN